MREIRQAINYFRNRLDKESLFTHERPSIHTALKVFEEKLQSNWIPVSERLPEKNGRLVATLKNGMVLECWWIGGTFKHSDGWKMEEFEFNEPIAWQPLPEPYNSELLKESD